MRVCVCLCFDATNSTAAKMSVICCSYQILIVLLFISRYFFRDWRWIWQFFFGCSSVCALHLLLPICADGTAEDIDIILLLIYIYIWVQPLQLFTVSDVHYYYFFNSPLEFFVHSAVGGWIYSWTVHQHMLACCSNLLAVSCSRVESHVAFDIEPQNQLIY